MENNIKVWLKQLVALKSEYPYEKYLTDYLIRYFRKQKYQVGIDPVQKDRCNLYLEKGQGRSAVLLYAHLDTIKSGNNWRSDPYRLSISGDKAYGLGAWDMKGGMTVNILNFLRYKPINYKLKLAFCIDEENISLGGYKLAGSNFIKDVACIISTEPAFMHGNQGIVTGRMGRAVYQLCISANPVHTAYYKPRYDINLLTGKILTSLVKLYKKNNDQKQFVFARKIISETNGMSTPTRTVIELEAAIIPPMSNVLLLTVLKKIVKTLSIKFPDIKISVDILKRETPFLDAYQLHDSSYLKNMKKSIYEVTGKKTVTYFRSSVADENIFGAKGLPVLGIGASGGNAHSANEWVSLKSLAVLSQIINNYLIKVDKIDLL